MSWGFQKFSLFNKNFISDPKLLKIISDDLTCVAPNSTGCILFGTTKGYVHRIDSSLNHTTIPAFKRRVNCILGLSLDKFLVAGDDEVRSSHDTIRVFQFKGDQWIILKEWKLVTIASKEQNLFVSCIQKSQDGNQIALGFGNGSVALIQGEVSKGKGSLKLLPVPELNGPITGLGFAPMGDKHECLYCVTSYSVFRYFTKGKEISNFSVLGRKDPNFDDKDINGEINSPSPNDGCGGDLGCSTVTHDGNLVIATSSGFYYWNPEGKDKCFPSVGFEGKKVAIHAYKQYIVSISSSFVKNSMQQIVTIFDFESRYIAFKFGSESLQYGFVFDEWNSIFLIANEKKQTPNGQIEVKSLIMLEEKDVKTKIDTLKLKNQYKGALKLAKDDPQMTADIYKSYGDHLCSKRDFDTAVDQYIKTINYLEPSYVIRKFLDAQRIDNLTKYLEKLHELYTVTPAHTTLLLNCYTKLEDEESKKKKLDQFIEANSLHYDPDIAIKVCRQAGNLEHALKLATKHGHDDWYIKLHIEDFVNEKGNRNYKRALRHIETFPFEKAESFLKTYAKVLLSKIPKRTTNVLIRLCTSWFPIPSHIRNRSIGQKIEDMKQRILKKKGHTRTRSDEKYHFEFLGMRFGKDKDAAKDSAKEITNQTQTASTPKDFQEEEFSKKKGNADDFIQCFNGAPNSSFWLMVFLEHIINRNPKEPPQPKTIFNTLIELYLENKDFKSDNLPVLVEFNEDDEKEDSYDIYHADENSQSLPLERRLIDILQNADSNYDHHHVLVLLEEYKFIEGVLIIYEKLELYYDIIQYYMDSENSEKIIESCVKYGLKVNNDPNMWILALSYFSDAKKDYDDEIRTLLGHIEKNNILPPLMVVQILSKGQKIKIKTIKSYLSNKLQQEQRLIQNDMAEIKEFQQETNKMREELHQLRTEAKIFQLMTCSLCKRSIELPAIHFLCGHSYHSSCLPDSDECYVCSKQNSDFLNRKKSIEAGANNHEAFFKQLGKRAQDGFDTVSDYFGRAIFPVLNPQDLQALDQFDKRDNLSDDDSLSEDEKREQLFR